MQGRALSAMVSSGAANAVLALKSSSTQPVGTDNRAGMERGFLSGGKELRKGVNQQRD
jgi:hypothetical protein